MKIRWMSLPQGKSRILNVYLVSCFAVMFKSDAKKAPGNIGVFLINALWSKEKGM